MSNEKLVQLIRDGDRQLELWEQIRRFAMKTANRWLTALPLRYDVEFDDLMSAAYIAMCEAASTYKAERGWYNYHLETAYTALYGLRTARAANDPLNNAVSLSTPIDEDITLEDAVPDPNGAESFERVENDVYRQQLHDALCEAMEAIPAECSDVIRRRYFDGQTINSIAAEHQTTPVEIKSREYRGQRAMQRDTRLRGFNYYSGTGLSSFRRTGASIQENYLLFAENAQKCTHKKAAIFLLKSSKKDRAFCCRFNSSCTSQQIMDTKTKIIKHKKIDHRAPVVGA